MRGLPRLLTIDSCYTSDLHTSLHLLAHVRVVNAAVTYHHTMVFIASTLQWMPFADAVHEITNVPITCCTVSVNKHKGHHRIEDDLVFETMTAKHERPVTGNVQTRPLQRNDRTLALTEGRHSIVLEETAASMNNAFVHVSEHECFLPEAVGGLHIPCAFPVSI